MVSIESPSTPVVSPAVRSKKGLGTAALVLGVASLVAVLSFVLLPLGLLGSIAAVAIGVAALTRGRAGGTANPGQATAGLVCGILALAIGIAFSVRIGTLVANNTSVFTSFSNCIAKAGNRSEVANCIARFAKGVR
jgi:thiamine transporter ThiT